MSHRCYTDEDLGALESLAADDPGRAHLDSCAGCRARLATYHRFMSACLDQADPQREAALADSLAAVLAAEAHPARLGKGRDARHRRSRRSRLWAGGLATAAVLLLMVAFSQYRDTLPTEPGTIVRGDGPGIGLTDLVPTASRTATGTLQLSWQPWPTADGYRIILLNDQLDEVFRRDVAGPQDATLTKADVPTSARVWSLEVLVAGEVVHTTAPLGLPGQ